MSRAPQRRNSGAAHKETIYAQPLSLKEKGSVTEKIALSNLTLKDLGEPDDETKPCKLMDPHRNEKLYTAIRSRLKEHDGKGDKAFTPENPLHKPDKHGNQVGPIVRTVTRVIDKLSGIPIRGGIAKNDSMVRVDIFEKGGRFYPVPIYSADLCGKNGLPNKAAVGKNREKWPDVSQEGFDFQFSAYPNELLQINFDNEPSFIGYFIGLDVSDGRISARWHDQQKTAKDQFRRVVHEAKSIVRLHVDVLGNIYPAPKEERRGLA